MRKSNKFSVFHFLEDDAYKHIINICDNSFEKFILKIEFQFVDSEKYKLIMQLVIDNPSLKNLFRNISNIRGCVHKAKEGVISTPEICETCQLHV